MRLNRTRLRSRRHSTHYVHNVSAQLCNVLYPGLPIARTGGRAKTFGSLLVGAYDEHGRLDYIGRVGSGFSEHKLRDLNGRLEKLARTTSPFAPPLPPTSMPAPRDGTCLVGTAPGRVALTCRPLVARGRQPHRSRGRSTTPRSGPWSGSSSPSQAEEPRSQHHHPRSRERCHAHSLPRLLARGRDVEKPAVVVSARQRQGR